MFYFVDLFYTYANVKLAKIPNSILYRLEAATTTATMFKYFKNMAAPAVKRSLKRKSSSDEMSSVPAKKSSSAPGHWALGLTASMNDPELKVEEDDKVVIIKDKYPKVKYRHL